MTRFAVDYSGWMYVDAKDEQDAMSKVSWILSSALPYDFNGGDWEIVHVEEGV